MKGNQHEEVRSLLDGQIKAAAGAVVGAKNQHHILVADGAAQGFLISHQRHGVDGLQTLHQTLRVILALIQSHKANHALQDAGAEGIGVTLPALCQHGQGFFVEVCAVGFVLLESRADADDLPRSTVAVQTELQTGAFGGVQESMTSVKDMRKAQMTVDTRLQTVLMVQMIWKIWFRKMQV